MIKLPGSIVSPIIVNAAWTLYDEMPAPIVSNDITRLYLHWRAGGMGCMDDTYNFTTSYVNGHYHITQTHDPRNNFRSTFSEEHYAADTYHRNRGSLGLVLNGMDKPHPSDPEVTPYNFGVDGITEAGQEWFCGAGAAICLRYGIDAMGASLDDDPPYYYGENNIETHAWVADNTGVPSQYAPYGPLSTMERWDFGIDDPIEQGKIITAQDVASTSYRLAYRIHEFKRAMMKGR